MIFALHLFFCSMYYPPSQKKVHKRNLKHPCFLERFFLKRFFCVGQTEKMKSPEKPNRKRRKEKHNKRKQKCKKQLKNRKDFLKKKRKSRGDKKKLFFQL